MYFRLLQLNLYESAENEGAPDSIRLYDGDIYNITTELLAEIVHGNKNDTSFYTTSGPSLSMKLHASAGSGYLGFIAEVVTLPVSTFIIGKKQEMSLIVNLLLLCFQ